MKARTPTKVLLPMEPADRSGHAVAAVLLGLLEALEANLEGALSGSDPKALHDLRVAIRRSRSVQREFKRVFPEEELRVFRNGFRWLQRATGQTRDLDVQMVELAAASAVIPETLHPELERLRELLETRRQAARAEMASALRSKRARALLSDWRSFLSGLGEASGGGRAQAERPVGRLAGKRIRKVYRRMVKRGRRIGPGSPSEPYHELRKHGKELRYLLELFGTPLYPEEAVKPMVSALKRLQDVLGRHQDRETQIDTLGDVGAQQPGDGQPALDPQVIQLLVEQLVGDKLAARRDFEGRFEAFATRQRDQTVKRVFQ